MEENGFDPQERDETPPSYQTPPEVWLGPWKEVADLLGIYDWRVWIAVTAALSARASRNIHVNYHGYLYGMGAYLLVAPSGTGKSLVTSIASLLLPPDYPTFDSVESGQALAESLADIERDAKGKIVRIASHPAALITSEWSQLLKTVDFHGSSLLERIHKAVDGEHALHLNRADKQGQGKLRIPDPTLTILGTTTIDHYLDLVKSHHIHTGFMNRHFILPTEAKPWKYNDPNPTVDFGAVAAYRDRLPVAHTLGLGEPLAQQYTRQAWEYDNEFGVRFLEPLRADAAPRQSRDLFGRLHAYHRRIALLYAWAVGSEYIFVEHVKAAEAAVRTSHQFLSALHGHQAVDMPAFVKYRSDLEERILQLVRTQPGLTRAHACQALRHNGGYTAIGEAVARLVEGGALVQTAPGQGRGRKVTLSCPADEP